MIDIGLSIISEHTRERIDVPFIFGNRLNRDSLPMINHLMRDHRTGATKSIDLDLILLLCVLPETLGTSEPLRLISGYRSPQTNEMLRRRSRQVARNSYHLRGQAADIRIAGVPLIRVRQAALELGFGGVGFYPGSDFVHVDTGPLRQW